MNLLLRKIWDKLFFDYYDRIEQFLQFLQIIFRHKGKEAGACNFPQILILAMRVAKYNVILQLNMNRLANILF